MNKQHYITRFVSGLLLVIFFLGITPKKFLHDIIAQHTDSKPGPETKTANGHPFQLNQAGYNCDCDNLVAESPFITSQYSFSFHLFSSFSSYVFKNISYTSNFGVYTLLRGPPVNS